MWTILNIFENPAYPLLGPTLWGLQSWGLWQPKPGISRYLYNILHIYAVIFVASQYVELWFIRDNLDLALRNLSVSMLSTVCVVKSGTFVLWQKEWQSIFDFITNNEKYYMNKCDASAEKIIADYKKYSRTITYSYWCLTAATVVTVVFTPLASFLSSSEYRMVIRNGSKPYPEIMSSWTPFDRSRGFGYFTSLLIHSHICVYGGGIVANYDANAVVLMTFFAGQLRLLKYNCERLFGNDNLNNYKLAMENIRECHIQHNHLVRYANILNSVMSPVLFLYVIICSLMICASAIQLTSEGATKMQQIWIAEYLAALIAQLFLYCWHSNQVLYMSLDVNAGVYESQWWSQDVRVRRYVLLLAGQLNKKILFTAGPFTTLSVSTFVTILKGSYSYYTLLSKKEV